MGNVIISLVIVFILGLSISKVISEKRKGIKCIGCPHSKSCSNAGGINLIK
ncbi:MAG: FeoB-associated Cys-rich membrane protein [Clostridium sp.]